MSKQKAIDNIKRFERAIEVTSDPALKAELKRQILELKVRWGLPSPTTEVDLESLFEYTVVKPLYKNGREDKYLMLKNEES